MNFSTNSRIVPSLRMRRADSTACACRSVESSCGSWVFVSFFFEGEESGDDASYLEWADTHSRQSSYPLNTTG